MSEDTALKQQAHALVDSLDDDATWAELAYLVFVRQKVEQGRRDSREGRALSHEEVLREFSVPQ